MKYYAKYSFVKKEGTESVYILKDQYGEVKNLNLGEYKVGELKGVKYLRFEVPREASIRKYFSHTFTGKDNAPITSTEELNDKKRTFGDTKKIGLSDLILIQFYNNMEELDMWFVKDLGNTKQQKQAAFREWNELMNSKEQKK